MILVKNDKRIVSNLIIKWNSIVSVRMDVQMMHNVFKMIQHVHQHRFVFGQHVFIEDDANSLRLDLVFLLMLLGYEILPDIRLIDQLVIVQVSSALIIMMTIAWFIKDIILIITFKNKFFYELTFT